MGQVSIFFSIFSPKQNYYNKKKPLTVMARDVIFSIDERYRESYDEEW